MIFDWSWQAIERAHSIQVREDEDGEDEHPV